MAVVRSPVFWDTPQTHSAAKSAFWPMLRRARTGTIRVRQTLQRPNLADANDLIW